MSIVTNTNFAASMAGYNLERTNQNLLRSLNRLSSGLRINSSSDDAGGLAVSMKLSAAIRRSKAVEANVANSISFLQTQDGVMNSADKVISRLSTLAALALDVTKNASDVSNYDAEFQGLQQQLAQFSSEKFNGISLFIPESSTTTAASAIATKLTMVTSEDAAQTTEISIHPINTDPWLNMLINGFVSFADPSDSTRRIFVPNSPQDINGFLETGETFDLDQTTTITQNWSDTFSLPAGHLSRSATIPAHNYIDGSGNMIAAAIAVTVPVAISSPASPPLTSLGGNSYSITTSPYVSTATYRDLAENLRSGTYVDPLHAGTTSTSSLTVQYNPSPATYTRPEDASTGAITLDNPSDTTTETLTLEPWTGNAIASSAANVSSSTLTSSSAEEFGVVARMAIQSLANMRAQNGAEQSHLHFSKDVLAGNQISLESAVSKIMDVDVASESTQLARFSILQQAGTAMSAQANQSAQSLLKLLEQN